MDLAWDWVPEFAFAQSELARFAAEPSGSHAAARPDFLPSPFLCSFLDFARTYFSKKDRAVLRGGDVTDIP